MKQSDRPRAKWRRPARITLWRPF